jgi:hypothetical protein
LSTSFSKPRLSGVAGVLFVVLSFVAAGINVPLPAYDEDPAEIMAWFADHGSTYPTGHVIAGLAFLLFYLPFFAGLCERLREAEGAPATWSRVAWAGAVASPVVGTIAGTFIMGAVLRGVGLSPDVATFAIAANFYAYVVAGGFGGVAMLGTAVVVIRTRVFPRWLGWTGAVVGAAAIASVGTFVENDPQGLWATVNGLAWVAYFLWIVAVSVGMLRQARPRSRSDTTDGERR